MKNNSSINVVALQVATILLILVILSLKEVKAQDLMSASGLYNQGNKYYSEGNYSAAVNAYEEAIKRVLNASLYYNLGNAYFKAGKNWRVDKSRNFRKNLSLNHLRI